MISDNIEITVHIANLALPLAVKQIINNTCRLKGVFGMTSLFIYISYNIIAKSMCMCVPFTASEEIHID